MEMQQKQPNMPLFFICYILFLLPVGPSDANKLQALVNRKFSFNGGFGRYAVIFDAGDIFSKVHVFRFNSKMNLLEIDGDFDYYEEIKPGLSFYEYDPEAAALSLQPLLLNGQAVVPEELRHWTPLKLGATADLRILTNNASEKILQAVRDLFEKESSLEYKAEWVSILEGSEKGSYMWITINYLLGTIGRAYSGTVCTINLGGRSVEIAYAISEENAEMAPATSIDGGTYVIAKYIKGTKFNLYVYSYLYYGLMAARAEILNLSGNSSSPCIVDGYDGFYTYGGVDYKASSPQSGSSFEGCRELTIEALKVDAPCEYEECTFNGTWSGGGGEGQNNIYLSSYFSDIAKEVGMISEDAYSAEVRPIDFQIAAEVACVTKYEDVESIYPDIYGDNIPYVCLDLVYVYSLLVDGFGIYPYKKVTLVNEINYKGTQIEASWPLGAAIDLVSSCSSLSNFLVLKQ